RVQSGDPPCAIATSGWRTGERRWLRYRRTTRRAILARSRQRPHEPRRLQMPRSGTPSRRVFIEAALAALAAAPTALHAQSGGVVRFALPNATASGVDAITRAAAGALGRALDA